MPRDCQELLPGLTLVGVWMHSIACTLQEEDIETADGVKIHGWLLYLERWSEDFMRTRPVILFFQVR